MSRTLNNKIWALIGLLIAVPVFISPVTVILTVGIMLYCRANMARALNPWIKSGLMFVLAVLMLSVLSAYDPTWKIWFWTVNTALMLTICMHFIGGILDEARNRRETRRLDSEVVDPEWYNPKTGKWER